MKTLSRSIAIMLLTMTFAHAGNEGGGGGGICTPIKCLTLAEAGLRVDVQGTNQFSFTVEQVKDLEKVIDMLPVQFDKKEFRKKILGRSTHYVLAQESDITKFAQFKKEYEDLLKGSAFALDSVTGFELLAATAKNKTFLLPGFDRLTTRGKSLIFIHEGLIRSYKATVLQALAFDGHVLDSIKAIEGQESNFNYMAMVELLEDLRIVRRAPTLRVSGQVLERRIIDSILEVHQMKWGLVFTENFTLLQHSSCVLKVSEQLDSSIETALMQNGFFIQISSEVNDGDLILSRYHLNQTTNGEYCKETNLTGLIQYQRNNSLITVAGGTERRTCVKYFVEMDADHAAKKLFPKCQVR